MAVILAETDGIDVVVRTSGTSHFQNASRASDQDSQGYAALAPFLARNTEATRSLFEPGVDPDPATVAEEITRILALPHGARPSSAAWLISPVSA
ncbi:MULTISPECIES: hypothetical protein [unclassified Streptomyces]|uniref:hypothetical protein n=1 Tax=unclassified Streptomyces TaxID=2593676 RepID=UPI0003A86520|nr:MULTISPECIES: hypothetical protein [unclassified Streptomyces]MYQ82072.1 hypothetical protein [Streptomyces sp. SID4923]